MAEKVLFLNPPGAKIYIRDYYCSKVSKAYYLPQPVDLLMQTGFFAQKGYQLKVVDAIAEKLTVKATNARIKEFQPDLIITLCGSVSFGEDEAFFQQLKNEIPQTKILSSGDLFLEDPEYFLKCHPWLDGIITDFFSDCGLKYLEGSTHFINGLVTRENGKPAISNGKQKWIDIPRPSHELFKNHLYRMPFANQYPMATVLTNYACPYPCTFCIMSTLEFKSREPNQVMEELLFLKENGIRYLYFSDQTFYLHREATEKILDFMIEEELGFSWVCFSRVDVLDEDKMRKMKAAGCNVIMFGVEWAEDEYCQKYKKQYTLAQVKNTFELAKKVGIKRMGTFLIGVPGQSAQSIKNTVNFAIQINADYASFNVAVPRANTSFRSEAIEQGLISPDERVMDQSGSFITMGTGLVSPEEIMSLKKEAYRRFYFRPSYLAKRLLEIENYQELKTHLREGYHILKSLIG